MIISELVGWLTKAESDYGDIEVVVNDADTDWLLKITKDDLAVVSDAHGVRAEIGPDYRSERIT